MEPIIIKNKTEEQCEFIRKVIGYTKNLEPMKEDKSLIAAMNILCQLPSIPAEITLPSLTLAEVKEKTQSIFCKYFQVHDIAIIDLEKPITIYLDDTGAEVAQKINSQSKMASPFEIPINLTKEGTTLDGELKKSIPLFEKPGYIENLNIPFSSINLCDNVNLMTAAIYAHEIAHALTESVKGYTQSYFNKEVISIFIEKLVALELDPSKELLRTLERSRYKHAQDCYKVIQSTNLPFLSSRVNFTKTELLDASTYIHSTFIATKLFDIYQNARKEKDKFKIIKSIQAIFDGEKTVEKLLLEQQVDFNKGKDINLIKRHI